MSKILRVAFFADSYKEINGVATTSRRLAEFAKRREKPFFIIYGGDRTEETTQNSVNFLELKRSRAAVPMDETLAYDPLFQRHHSLVMRRLARFRPDVFHITGLNDVSILGAYLSHKWKIPLVASWHTNLHEFSTRRLEKMLSFVPDAPRSKVLNFIENKILSGAIYYYKMGKVVLSPNDELVELLGKGTKRPSYLMLRGVDTEFYKPSHRTVNDDIFRIGFCGRLRPEKNVRVLAALEKRLHELGKTNFKFLIVGEGSEREWLAKNMRNAEFTGFLEGQPLAAAYADMDVFVFPSETETFGNVVQEANASGVPVVVSDKGGPKFIIEQGGIGHVARTLEDYVKAVTELMDNREKLPETRREARRFALSRSWDAVFEKVFDAYEEAFEKRSAQIKTDFSDVK